MKHSVVIAEDHTMVLEGLRALLSLEPDLEIVGLCKDGLEAVDAVLSARPDVLVMDWRMPSCDGIEARERLRDLGAQVPTVLLTARMDDATLRRCLALGVEGLLLKEAAGDELVEAIRAVATGERWIADDLTSRALRLFTTDAQPGSVLSPRELEVVRLVAAGGSNKRVAAELGISVGTVKLHLRSVFSKLAVSNRVQLSLVARERDWI